MHLMVQLFIQDTFGNTEKKLADELFFLIFHFLCQPKVTLSTLEKLSAHQWVFRILTLSEVA